MITYARALLNALKPSPKTGAPLLPLSDLARLREVCVNCDEPKAACSCGFVTWVEPELDAHEVYRRQCRQERSRG